jgi:hypothetical protein
MQCKSADGEYFNVEMSMNPDKFEPVRLEYYAGKLFTGQDIRGADKTYRELKMAYQIAFLANRYFFEDGEFLHIFKYYDPGRGTAQPDNHGGVVETGRAGAEVRAGDDGGGAVGVLL